MNRTLDIQDSVRDRLSRLGAVRENEPMRIHTSFRTGGAADILFYPRTDEAAAEAVAILYAEGIPYSVVGGCTNLVVGDGGIPGVVFKMSADDASDGDLIREMADGRIYCTASVKKTDFIRFAISINRGGVEF
ncbi:MAG: hypothetical protein ACOC2H_08975, partial [Spirochaetota bacterium]